MSKMFNKPKKFLFFGFVKHPTHYLSNFLFIYHFYKINQEYSYLPYTLLSNNCLYRNFIWIGSCNTEKTKSTIFIQLIRNIRICRIPCRITAYQNVIWIDSCIIQVRSTVLGNEPYCKNNAKWIRSKSHYFSPIMYLLCLWDFSSDHDLIIANNRHLYLSDYF
jgi:hypothetical protein